MCMCMCAHILCVCTNLTDLCYPYRPDGQKKAYVRLAPDYDALDVANKVSQQQNVLLL